MCNYSPSRPLLYISVACGILSLVSAYQWPQPQLDAFEKFVFEGSRPDSNEMFTLLNNCGFRSLDPKKTTIAATWLRFSYHDAATFNITDKTGGLDGSVHFELDRPESIGSGLKLTQGDYSAFPSKYVSKADVIAVGAAFAVANCGGPIIPLRGGRVDSNAPGLPGVPEPQQDLNTHTEKFRLQGFNATEMIEIVACGHTLGGVESIDFPFTVDPPTNDPKVSRLAPFDNTTAFDTAVVTQYLDGSTLNPLVVGHNETTRSDLRIFSSDGNITMKALADKNVFQERCKVLLERMLHNVPAGVQLTDPIQILPEKPQYSGLRILNGNLTFFTALRVARPSSSPFINGSHMSLYWCDRYGADAECQRGYANRVSGAGRSNKSNIQSPITSGLGLDFRYYWFQAPINASRSVSSFWYQLDNGNGTTSIFDNGGAKYPLLQDQIMYPAALAKFTGQQILANDSILTSFFFAAGVREELKPSRVYANILDFTHSDRPVGSVVNITMDLTENSTLPSVPGYKLYSGNFSLLGAAPTIDFYVDANGTTSMLDAQPIAFVDVDLHTTTPFGTVETVPYTPPKDGSLAAASSAQSLRFISFNFLTIHFMLSLTYFCIV